MLDKMREGSQGVAAKVILIVIILSFALAGVSSYIGGSSVPVAVVVNGEEISQSSVEQAYQNERANLQQQYGEQFELLASTPNFIQQIRAQATQTLITERLIAQAINDMGLRIGDDQVKDEIRRMPEFQVDGKFNNEQYLSLLRRASYTPAQFSESLKQDLARRQLLTMLVDSEFVLPSEVEQVNLLQAQQRIAKVLTVNANDFADTTPATEEEIAAYYESNSHLFQTAEQVSLEYVLLDATELTDRIVVLETDIEDYYDMHSSDYQRNERRKVAHILIQGGSEVSREKAEVILTELQSGADFAKLATEKSDDTYSATNNGELTWFERGVMDPAFDEASFALTESAPLSGLVETEFGYHIIKLLDIEESQRLPLTEVRNQVEVALQQEKMNEVYYELHQSLSEIAFEVPDNLEEAAASIDAQVQRTELFSAETAPEALADNAVLQIVFDPIFREDGLNSDIIELSETKSVVVRVNEYEPASLQPVEAVSEQIAMQLQDQKARQAAQAYVDTIIEKLNAAESVDSLLAEKELAFSTDVTFSRDSRDYDYQVLQSVFKLAKPEAGQFSYDSVSTSTGDFAVIELSEVIEADASLESNEYQLQIEQVLARSTSEATYQSLISLLMANAEIKYPVAE
ncbi:MAG: SurA N-terminal domain-containing protein [Psychromonas sp.]